MHPPGILHRKWCANPAPWPLPLDGEPGVPRVRRGTHLRTDVDWYRNVVDAGSCVVIHHRVEYRIDAVEPYGTAAGRAVSCSRSGPSSRSCGALTFDYCAATRWIDAPWGT